MTTDLHSLHFIPLCRLTLVAAIGISLAAGCGKQASPTNTNTTSQSQSTGEPPGIPPVSISTDQVREQPSPVKAPSESAEQATAALKKLNAVFEQEPSLGGLFIDFGLILGNFPNEEFVHLQAIPKIAAIRLPEGVTDAGLAHLKGLSTLKSVAILGNNVTDSGLEQLDGLTALESVIIWSSKVTDAGVNRLKQALPKCQVTVNR
jgi:hypothetical protein